MTTPAADTEDTGITLLYVEDEDDARGVVSEIVSHHFPDVRLHVCRNGEDGIRAFRQYNPEVVITDINMPVVNGIVMATEIKALNPAVEIIALTAHTNTQYLLQAIEIGISNYILKPVDIVQMIRVIDKALGIVRADRTMQRQNRMIRELNDRLLHKTEELEAANMELESFNYTVAHDLRTPMVTIGGFARRLLEQYSATLDEKGRECLGIIQRETGRMSSLIGVLLKFSSQTRRQIKKKWTDLGQRAGEIAATLTLTDPERRVEFRIADGVKGFCDPDLIGIVLENLIGNAWKYSAHKSDACIEFGTLSREDDQVYFVRDNGAGFDQQDAVKLFAPFQRLLCAGDTEGFGIGLATAQRIIQRHGGRIWAEGEPGTGATFYFTL